MEENFVINLKIKMQLIGFKKLNIISDAWPFSGIRKMNRNDKKLCIIYIFLDYAKADCSDRILPNSR